MRTLTLGRLFIGIAACVLLNCKPGIAADTEQIDSFDVQITINQDSTINVTETIGYNFGDLQRHGIFRTIPTMRTTSPDDGQKMDFEILSVTDELDNPYTYADESTSSEIYLKIGNPDSFVTGLETYKISYTVNGALLNINGRNEFYWNITGNEWQIPILYAASTVTVPNPSNLSLLNKACYTGEQGSKADNCQISSNGSNIFIETTDRLDAYQGLTIAIGSPDTIITQIGNGKTASIFDGIFVYLYSLILFMLEIVL